MNNLTRADVRKLIKQFTGQDNVISVPRVFIKFTGSADAALMLNQLLYWSERTDDPDGWFYKTADQWEAEIGLSKYKVTKIVGALKGFVHKKVKKVAGTPKTHYRVDHDKFHEAFLTFLESQETSLSESEKPSLSSKTEITAETTEDLSARPKERFEETLLYCINRSSRMILDKAGDLEVTTKRLKNLGEGWESCIGHHLNGAIKAEFAEFTVVSEWKRPEIKKPSAYSSSLIFDALAAALFDATDSADKIAVGGRVGPLREKLVDHVLAKRKVPDLDEATLKDLADHIRKFPAWFRESCPGCDLPQHPNSFMPRWLAYTKCGGKVVPKPGSPPPDKKMSIVGGKVVWT